MGDSLPSSAKLVKWVLSSPPAEWTLKQLRELLIGALKQGPVPQHVAFVMDGNRRYARQNSIETVEGHSLGFEALARILEVCYRCGVKAVTIYAFSIENFKRSKHEVDALMEMAKVKLVQLAQHGDLLDRYGACIRILGQRDLVKPDVLEAMDESVRMTAHNKQAILNICFPYTSRDEITTAIRNTVADYSKPLNLRPPKRPFSERRIANSIRSRRLSTLGEESSTVDTQSENETSTTTAIDLPSQQQQDTNNIPQDQKDDDENSSQSTSSSQTLPSRSTSDTSPHSRSSSPPTTSSSSSTTSSPPPQSSTEHKTYPDPESITTTTLDDHMFTAGCPPLDLLVRTSGVERLSDFLLWQCHEKTSIVFLDCLWPEFDLYRFLPVLVEWQWWRIREGGGRWWAWGGVK